MNFEELAASYRNSAEWHGEMFDALYQKAQETPWLKEHRDWVEQREWGMGDRPFHEVWRLIVEMTPDKFRFLEIGCYRGQILSLIGLIAKRMNKTPLIVGVSPFRGTVDSANSYNDTLNYRADIKTIFNEFQVPFDWFVPIAGLSQQPSVIIDAMEHMPYDIIYIDGSHEYDNVQHDIENYAPMLSSGGILVMDDASCNLNMPAFSQDKGYNRCWAGIQTVSNAVRDYLEPRKDFVHCFAIGHMRVFKKL